MGKLNIGQVMRIRWELHNIVSSNLSNNFSEARSRETCATFFLLKVV